MSVGQKNVAVGSASVSLAPANNSRVYVLIVNNDPVNTVYIAFGTNNAAAVVGGIQIPPGGNYELGPMPIEPNYNNGSLLPTGDIAAITAGPTVNVTVFEQ